MAPFIFILCFCLCFSGNLSSSYVQQILSFHSITEKIEAFGGKVTSLRLHVRLGLGIQNWVNIPEDHKRNIYLIFVEFIFHNCQLKIVKSLHLAYSISYWVKSFNHDGRFVYLFALVLKSFQL
jgi:hypothetical protein